MELGLKVLHIQDKVLAGVFLEILILNLWEELQTLVMKLNS